MSKNQIEIISADQREVELLEKNRKINLQKLFTPEGMDLIIAEIEKETSDFEADISTKKGQAEIKSMAAKVAKCKAPIKALSMELKEESRRLIEGVNSQWNRYEAAMDDLRDKIRKPVDEIEEQEAKILKERQDRLAEIESYKNSNSNHFANLSIQQIDDAILQIEAAIKIVKQLIIFDWEDFSFKAETLGKEVLEQLNQSISSAKIQKEKDFELAKLRAEAAERAKKDREEQIAKDAADKAKRDAEEEKKRIEQERLDAEKRAKDAEELAAKQAKESEERRVEAERKAKEDAKKAAEEAVEKERLRVQAEQEAERKAKEKREANKRRRTKIEKESVDSIRYFIDMVLGADGDAEDIAQTLVLNISKGEIPNIQINY